MYDINYITTQYSQKCVALLADICATDFDYIFGSHQALLSIETSSKADQQVFSPYSVNLFSN